MGSSPEGTMCWYCNQQEAGYIPDGLMGPTCDACTGDWEQFGPDFLDRRRRDRFLHSLRAVTGGQAGLGRNHLFHQLFLDVDAELGHTLATILIWTLHSTRGGLAVAAQTEDEEDDLGFPLLWEDQWHLVMQAELGRGIAEAEAAGRHVVVPHWTLDRVRPEWHQNAYRALRTPHGRTQLVNATRRLLRARYETNQTELFLREAEELLRDAEENLRIMQRNALDARHEHGQAIAREAHYDTFHTRHAERYQSAWAILAWMTRYGPVVNLRAENPLAGFYWEQLTQWDRFQQNRPRDGEDQHWDDPDDDWTGDEEVVEVVERDVTEVVERDVVGVPFITLERANGALRRSRRGH